MSEPKQLFKTSIVLKVLAKQTRVCRENIQEGEEGVKVIECNSIPSVLISEGVVVFSRIILRKDMLLGVKNEQPKFVSCNILYTS